jgi:hypothetical protein
MKIKVTKVFANFINETAKTNGLKFRASVVEFSDNLYNYFVGPYWSSYTDYNAKTGKYKAICIEYPPEYYAPLFYLSTHELNRLCNVNGVETADDLKALIVDEFSI